MPMPAASTPLSAIMTSPVRCVSPETPLRELAQYLVHAAIGATPVVLHGKPIGIVSKTDVLRRCCQDFGTEAPPPPTPDGGYMADLRPKPTKVAEIMTCDVTYLDADTSISRACALMASEGFHHVVVTANAAVVGIVSSLDVMRWVARCDGHAIPTQSPRRTR